MTAGAPTYRDFFSVIGIRRSGGADDRDHTTGKGKSIEADVLRPIFQ
jgi:hypothetical protein